MTMTTTATLYDVIERLGRVQSVLLNVERFPCPDGCALGNRCELCQALSDVDSVVLDLSKIRDSIKDIAGERRWK